MEDSKCPKCWKDVHPGHYDSHVEKCDNWIKYGIIIKFTNELIRCIFSEELMARVDLRWDLDFGEIITYIAMANVGIRMDDRDEVQVELSRSIKDDMYLVKIRSDIQFQGLYQIPEGGEYPCVIYSRKFR